MYLYTGFIISKYNIDKFHENIIIASTLNINMDEALQPKSIKKHYRIIVDFELDVPDESYVIVSHERKGLSKDLCGYALSCQRLTIYSKDHPKIGRFRRKPENIKTYFDNQEEFIDYSI